MKQDAHRFIMKYFSEHSHIEIDDCCTLLDNGLFKCTFTVESEDKNAVKIIMQYLEGKSEEDSWIMSAGMIGRMGAISNLFYILEYLNSNSVPSYALTMERPGRVLMLNRSFLLERLNRNNMQELTDGIAEKIRILRRLLR